MNMERRKFIGAGIMLATSGAMAGNTSSAPTGLSDRQLTIRGKTYVAACPRVKASIPRTPGPQRVMVIGAHPDDADITCGCTAASRSSSTS